MKKKGIGSEARAERMANADTDMQLLNEAERGRHLQKQKKRRLQGREDEVCCDFYLYLLFALCFLIPTLYSFYHLKRKNVLEYQEMG
jgi:hypothetical protein